MVNNSDVQWDADDLEEFNSHHSASVTDLGAVATRGSDGVVWSLPHGGDLDTNLVHLGPAAAIGEHRNREVDVLISVQSGSGVLTIDGAPHHLASEYLALIPRGCARSVVAGNRGLTYLSIHRRRAGLSLTPRSEH